MFPLLLFFLFFLPIHCIENNKPAEQINSFHADIYVNFDRSVTVHETITVYSLGNHIKRGIYRRLHYFYEFIVVQKDGLPCPYFIQHDRRRGQTHMQNLFIGDENAVLQHGLHTYSITYKSTKKLVYPLYENGGGIHTHDYINWDINGPNWSLPIKKLSASIHLCTSNIPQKDALFRYSTNYNMSAILEKNNVPSFYSTQEIPIRKNVDISVYWQKGFVAPVAPLNPLYHALALFLSNLSIPAAWIIIILTLLRMFFHRRRFLTKKSADQQNPPANILPEEASYIHYGKLSIDSFTSTLIDMAQRNYFIISKGTSDSYALIQQRTDDDTPIYRAIAKEFFKREAIFSLYAENKESLSGDFPSTTTTRKEIAKAIALMEKYCKDKKHLKQEPLLMTITLVLSGIILLLTIVLALPLSSLPRWPHTEYNYIPLFIGACISGIISYVLTRTSHTKKGALINVQLKSFKSSLRSQFGSRRLSDTRALLLQNLPYAMALNVTTENWQKPSHKILFVADSDDSAFHIDWYQEQNKKYVGNLSDSMIALRQNIIAIVPTLKLVSPPPKKKSKSSSRSYGRGGFGGGGGSGGGGW